MTRTPWKMNRKMKQLNRTEITFLLLGGLIMVLSAGLYVFFIMQNVVCWSMLLGAGLFVSIQMRQSYEGSNITIRRLRKILGLSGVCFILAGGFMVEDSYHFLESLFSGSASNYSLYINIFHHNWVVLLLVASILEIYVTHRISYELKKENEKCG